MMRKIKLVLSGARQDKLIISLPESLGALEGGAQKPGAAARIRLQQRRSPAGGHISYQPRRARAARKRRAARAKAGSPAAGWERVVEDRVKMIEMHAF